MSTELEPITLVEGGDSDLEPFFALEQKLTGPTYRGETKKEDIFGENKFFYMVKVGDKTVGQIAYEVQTGNTIYVNVFAIDPEFQGKGFGTEAMKQFLKKVSDYPRIWLVTHPDNGAVKLYESLGFKITERKENYFGNGTPRLVMEKQI